MSLFYRLSTLLAFALLLSGCDQGSTSKIEGQLAEAVDKIEALKGQVEALESKVEIQRILNDLGGVVHLTPGDNGYSVIESDLGALTIALEDIKPYANGSKVTLKFGNATAATINGLNAKLEWGEVNENGIPVREKSKSRTVKFNETLDAGAWTNAAVVLEGVPATELGFVRVSEVGHSGIKLHR